MKKEIQKWSLEKVEVIRNGKLDEEFSGYELQKNGITICKFSLESLMELKEFFTNLTLQKSKQDE